MRTCPLAAAHHQSLTSSNMIGSSRKPMMTSTFDIRIHGAYFRVSLDLNLSEILGKSKYLHSKTSVISGENGPSSCPVGLYHSSSGCLYFISILFEKYHLVFLGIIVCRWDYCFVSNMPNFVRRESDGTHHRLNSLYVLICFHCAVGTILYH